jgi:hypothetical protein
MRISAAVVTVGVVVAVMAATAPRAASAAVIPVSQSHLLTAHVKVGDAVADDSDTGATVGQVTGADARAAMGLDNALTTLDFLPGDRTISGHLSGDANGQPSGSGVTEARSDGNFQYTFTVTEATPFTLAGQLGVQGRFVDDAGRAGLLLTQDGVRIAGTEIGAAPGIPGGFFTVADSGTLLPGHTYALNGSLIAAVNVDPHGNLEFSNSDVDFNLTVPEPAAACLLALAALPLLARHRRPLS